ncbi:MAG: hypothetical protein ACRD1Z_07995 [Vicinamibacteria bacterium]
MSKEYARAFSAAFVADLARDPDLSLRVARGRVSAAGLRDEAFRDIARGVRGGRTRFPHLQRLVRQQMEVEKRVLRDAGVGAEAPAKPEANVWDAIGGAIAGAATIASNVLTTKYEAKGNEAVASLNAQSQQLSLQAQQLAAQTAARAAAGPPSETPGWVVPAAVGVGLLLVGGVVYAATRKRR